MAIWQWLTTPCATLPTAPCLGMELFCQCLGMGWCFPKVLQCLDIPTLADRQEIMDAVQEPIHVAQYRSQRGPDIKDYPIIHMVKRLMTGGHLAACAKAMVMHSKCRTAKPVKVFKNYRIGFDEEARDKDSIFARFLQRSHERFFDELNFPSGASYDVNMAMPDAAEDSFTYLFHGTPPRNVPLLAQNGMDPSKIRDGNDFYFSTDPEECKWHSGYKEGDTHYTLVLFLSAIRPTQDKEKPKVWRIRAEDSDNLICVGTVRFEVVEGHDLDVRGKLVNQPDRYIHSTTNIVRTEQFPDSSSLLVSEDSE